MLKILTIFLAPAIFAGYPVPMPTASLKPQALALPCPSNSQPDCAGTAGGPVGTRTDVAGSGGTAVGTLESTELDTGGNGSGSSNRRPTGGSSKVKSNASSSRSEQDVGEDPYKNCIVEHMTYLAPTVNLGNYDFAANGKTTKDGHIVKYSCRGGNTKADGGATNYTYIYVPNGKTAPAAPPPLPPPPPPPPDANDLALTASKTLTMPKPQIHWGPLPDQVVVNYPLWLWVDNPGAVGTSVSLRGVTVTMNATIDKIVWRTGEPTDPGNASSHEAVVECQGRGEPAPSIEEVAQIPVADRHPPCGYAYRWKSTPERTGGTGTWTMTAEVDWTLAWTSTINGTPGPRGTFALQSTNTASIQVLELKSALIANPTGSPGPNR